MPPFSPWIFSALVAIVLASIAMLLYLARTWTTGRRRSRIGEWARRHAMRETRTIPAPLEPHLTPLEPIKILFAFESDELFACYLRSPRTPGGARPAEPSTWLLIGKRLPEGFTPALAALRPARGATSLIDVLAADAAPKVWSYPSIEVAGDAYTVFAGSPTDAGQLVRSNIPATLPTDLGLLIARSWLILDASPRPPDEVELAKALQTLKELVPQG